MPVEHVFVAKKVETAFTAVFPLSRAIMRPRMIMEIFICREHRWTQVALVWFWPLMRLPMGLESL